MKKLNIVLIGYGYWGKKVYKSLKNKKYINVVSIIDTAIIKKKIKEKYFNNINKFIGAKINYDAAVVCTPPNTHYRIAKKFLLNKKHVLVEKPIVLKKSHLRDIFDISKSKKKVLLAGDLFLYCDGINKIKNIIDNKKYGSIKHIESLRLNWGIVRKDVNPIISLATHDISIILYLNNYKKVNKIHLRKFYHLRNKIFDEANINFSFFNKVSGEIKVSWAYPDKIRKLIVHLEKCVIKYDDTDPKFIYLFTNKYKKKIKVDIKNYPLDNQIEYFYKAIKYKKKFKELKTGYLHSKNMLEFLKGIK